MIALSSKQTWDYVLEADRKYPKEKQTRFKLRSLTGAERATFKDVVVNQGFYSGLVTAALFGLLGWENLRDASGNKVDFITDKDTKTGTIENFDVLDDAVYEIGRAIVSRSQMEEADQKNLSSAGDCSPETLPDLIAKPATNI